LKAANNSPSSPSTTAHAAMRHCSLVPIAKTRIVGNSRVSRHFSLVEADCTMLEGQMCDGCRSSARKRKTNVLPVERNREPWGGPPLLVDLTSCRPPQLLPIACVGRSNAESSTDRHCWEKGGRCREGRVAVGTTVHRRRIPGTITLGTARDLGRGRSSPPVLKAAVGGVG
jgi:hypothetical protein